MSKLNFIFSIKKKNIFYVVLILLIILFSFFIGSQKNEMPTIENIENTIIQDVLVEKIQAKKFSKKLILRGHTRSSRTVIIRSQVEGKISSINYKKGEFVDAGKQIVLINPEDKVAKSKEMEALLKQRKKEYEVAEKLFKNGYRSEVKLSESRTKFEESLALYEKSQVELSNTKISIPFDSIIDKSFVELGDYLKKGDKIITIVDLDPIFLVASVSEKDVNSIRVGQNGIAYLSNGKKISGKINYISVSANKKTRNFEVQLELSNKNNRILAGISGEIELSLNPVDSFFIPSSIVTLNKSGKLGVKVVENGRAKFFPINILSDTGSGFWISNNKKLELDVITRGQEYVLDGDLVNESYSE